MSNPFDNQDGIFLVLRNAEGQHSFWPETIDVPAGWDVACGPAPRVDCLAYVEHHWTDLRPRNLWNQ
ncbi:MbtH family protein [Streptomyces sp. GD-15H]|uniref:MbtH family protein n=1 Tax=Streptomyces sp. GD-15H TaxID=3129112 RepID=UPI0032511324